MIEEAYEKELGIQLFVRNVILANAIVKRSLEGQNVCLTRALDQTNKRPLEYRNN